MTKARDLANIISGGFTESDIPNLATSKITSGTFADARLPATALNSNVDLTTLSASNLTSGTVADARLPSTALNSNVDLTNLSGANLTSGTIPNARFGTPTFSGANLTNLPANGAFESKLCHIVTQHANNAGITSISANAWNKLPLNTIKTNEVSASMSSSVIVLQAGDYWIEGHQHFQNTGYPQMRLRNTTDSSSLATGMNHYAESGGSIVGFLSGRFTVGASKNLEVQYYTTAGHSNGLGNAQPNGGEVTKLSDIRIWKV